LSSPLDILFAWLPSPPRFFFFVVFIKVGQLKPSHRPRSFSVSSSLQSPFGVLRCKVFFLDMALCSNFFRFAFFFRFPPSLQTNPFEVSRPLFLGRSPTPCSPFPKEVFLISLPLFPLLLLLFTTTGSTKLSWLPPIFPSPLFGFLTEFFTVFWSHIWGLSMCFF